MPEKGIQPASKSLKMGFCEKQKSLESHIPVLSYSYYK